MEFGQEINAFPMKVCKLGDTIKGNLSRNLTAVALNFERYLMYSHLKMKKKTCQDRYAHFMWQEGAFNSIIVINTHK